MLKSIFSFFGFSRGITVFSDACKTLGSQSALSPLNIHPMDHSSKRMPCRGCVAKAPPLAARLFDPGTP